MQAECIANVKDYKREVESIISSKGNVLILWALSIPDLSKLRTEAEIEPNEILDFDQIVHDGWLPVRKEAKARFYTKLPSYQISLRKKKPFKHHKEVLRTETALFKQCLQFELDFMVQQQHLFPIQNQKRNWETLIETGRNQSVSRIPTAILAGTLKSNVMGKVQVSTIPKRYVDFPNWWLYLT